MLDKINLDHCIHIFKSVSVSIYFIKLPREKLNIQPTFISRSSFRAVYRISEFLIQAPLKRHLFRRSYVFDQLSIYGIRVRMSKNSRARLKPLASPSRLRGEIAASLFKYNPLRCGKYHGVDQAPGERMTAKARATIVFHTSKTLLHRGHVPDL